MNFAPFVSNGGSAIVGSSSSGISSGPFVSLSGSAIHQNILSTTAKLPLNIANAPPQIGQIVNLVPATESVQYIKTMDSSGAPSTPNHNAQQMFTLPIAMPGAKPGDPQQTIQIQVLNQNIQLQQGNVQTPKYQMQIPIQTFQQGSLGATLLTVAYTQEGTDGVQILGNATVPEGYQVVAAIQPQELQLLTAHLPTGDVQQAIANVAHQNSQHANKESQIQQTFMLSNGQQLIINQPSAYVQPEEKKVMINNNINNNNGPLVTIGQQTFRIKQEMFADEDCGMPLPLQQFLKFNPLSEIKREVSESMIMSSEDKEDNEDDKSLEGTSEKDPLMPTNDENMTGDQVDIKPKKKKKYKKKPPKPKKPKPGQVVIATALDGTTLFCCPECHMAYPDKDQLEQHLVGHKIERRYICGICGAGLKRKEHLERHKLGHNPDRPFTCSICMKGFKRKEHLNLHFVIHSGEKNEICTECGKGFYRKDHLRKHIKSHALRRSREELAASVAAGSENDITIDSANSDTQTSNITSVDSVSIHDVPVNNITIHVPTSSTSVPIQISVPQHIVSMANNQSQMMTVYTGSNGHVVVDEMLTQHT